MHFIRVQPPPRPPLFPLPLSAPSSDLNAYDFVFIPSAYEYCIYTTYRFASALVSFLKLNRLVDLLRPYPRLRHHQQPSESGLLPQKLGAATVIAVA